VIDEVLLTVFRAPKSYTAEDLVEINCHGGYLVLSKVLEQALNCGARLAQPGEFTLRAFVNGRIDLSQAEAVAELIRSKTDLGHKLALRHLKGDLSEKINSYRDKLINILARFEVEIDFSEEDIEPLDKREALRKIESIEKDLDSLLATYHDGKILRDGLNVVIIGRPNVGKSSLLNALLKEDRAIVTPIPGTTRDIISEYANFKGIPVRLVDTAGYRMSKDAIELEGIRRTKVEMSEADIILLVIDDSQDVGTEDLELERQIQFDFRSPFNFVQGDPEFIEGSLSLSKSKGKNSQYFIVFNKIDVAKESMTKKNEEKFLEIPSKVGKDKSFVRVSALKGDGIENLKEMIVSCALTLKKDQTQGVILSSLRHKDALTRAKRSLSLVKDSLHKNLSPEFVALDLKAALDAIGEVIGKTVTDDILNKIFSEFCIGK
jgi:tRNA modification GTPase